MNAPRVLRLAFGACALLWIGAGTTAQAAPLFKTVNVTIQGFAFAPSTITIDKGDVIRWTNFDTATHGAVTILPGFVTQNLIEGQSTTTLFAQPGTYAYHCTVHGDRMKGTVIVLGVADPASPVPTPAPGHIVLDTYAEARPDRFDPPTQSASAFLYASIALALVALARFVWVVRGT